MLFILIRICNNGLTICHGNMLVCIQKSDVEAGSCMHLVIIGGKNSVCEVP